MTTANEGPVFISYSHDSAAHLDLVLALSDRLRAEGVDCRIDQYEQSPAEGWPLWCNRGIEKSAFVLVACTEIYMRRFKGEEAPGTGRGGTWEGHIITQELYDAQGRNTKFIPIVFEQADGAFVPVLLRGATCYQINRDYERLYRRLTDQPLIRMPGLGSVQAMPAREPLAPLAGLARQQDFQTTWFVPYARNPFFTGREEVLRDLRAALEKHKSAALSGFGGLGKTQTALEYAYRYRAEYQAVFFARAETRDTLIGDFGRMAAALSLPSAGAKEQEVTVAEVKRWLETSAGWLLILDNADDAALAKDFLPNDRLGHVLLTTRARALGGLAERLAIRAMPAGEGAQLLLLRAGRLDKADEAELSLAEKLSRELGGLPLALDQAGAFIEETPSSLAEYLSLYISARGQLLAERGLGEHDSVTVTFSLAFAKVVEHSAAAADLIRLCAFLAPEAIPEQIVTAGAEYLGESLSRVAGSAIDFARVVKEATRFSLLERDANNKTLDVHRLVQAVIQAGMPSSDQKVWAERAVRAVERVFPKPEFENWGWCQKLVPHAQACMGLIDEWTFSFPEAGGLLNRMGFYFDERALFVEAEPVFQRSLAIWEKALGPDHPDVATSLNNLAELYRNQVKYSQAELLYLRSLAIREKALGPVHPDVAASLNNLAALYDDQGKCAQAEPLYQRSLAIWEKALGPVHPDLAKGLNNLASLYGNQGEYTQAEPLYQRSLAIREEALGPDHPNVATSLNNLAALFRKQRKYTEAEPLFQRSLAIREEALGDNHPDVATSLNNLAELYRNQGKYAQAEPLYQRSLVICEKALGPDHPNVAVVRSNLARCRASL